MKNKIYEHSALSSESDSDNNESYRIKKKKVKVQRPKSIGIESSIPPVYKIENPPPMKINNNSNTNSDARRVHLHNCILF